MQTHCNGNFEIRFATELSRSQPNYNFFMKQPPNRHLIVDQLEQRPDRHQRERNKHAANQPARSSSQHDAIVAVGQPDDDNQHPDQKWQRNFLQTSKPARDRDPEPPLGIFSRELGGNNCQYGEERETDVEQTVRALG